MDKISKPTDFYSFENLTIHSYRARIVAILKPWIYQQNKQLWLYDLDAFGNWLAKLLRTQWTVAFVLLNFQMNQQATNKSLWNNHWNNHIRFCIAIEVYLTLCYSIKWDDVGLLQIVLRKIYIIFQAPSANKPKYAREMLRQVHILDSNAADLVLCKAYIANALVNPQGLPHTFYEMDLVLEHQNRKFKQFQAD